MLNFKPLSAQEADDKIKRCLEELGHARGESEWITQALISARSFLEICSDYLVRHITPTTDLWPPKPKRKRK